MRRSQSIKENLQNNQSACRHLFERLNERDQRHVAGILALAIGHDGITLIGNLTGLARDTIAKGKKELLNNFADVPADRDRQMRLIRRETTRLINAAQPVIGVDAKKSELIGDFKNNGQKWEAEGTSAVVSAYDFPNTAKAVP